MWQTEMVTILRPMIGDISVTAPKYSDADLQQLILVAAQLIQTEVQFTQDYVIDADEFILTPDPTDRTAGTRDDSFINLTLIKAACVMDHSELRQAANKSIYIQDGGSAIDLSNNAAARLQILKEGWCKNLSRAKIDFAGGSGIAGAAVIGPFRQYADYLYGSYFVDGRYR